LQEVQDSTKNSPPPKSIILLGDNESGRSTLISRLKGVENISKGVGLEYHYIEVKDEERDDVPKLGVWIPDGDGSCGGVLKIALNESNFENTLIVFVVSMSSPWSIMDSLKKWSTIIREHVRKLNIPEEKRSEFLKRQERSFQMYQDPDETVNLLNKKSSSATNASSTSKQTRSDIDTIKQEKDENLLPLDPSVLSQNLGLPVVVVLTKVSIN
jgi:dynein light intermediate chain 1